MFNFLSYIRFSTIFLSSIFFIMSSSVYAERNFEPLPQNYPHPVNLVYNSEPLVCSDDASIGWADTLLVFKDLPPGAAGGVIHTINESPVILWWKHPFYDPLNKQYIINMTAQAMKGMPGISRVLASFVRPLESPRSEGSGSKMTASISGVSQLAQEITFTDTRLAIFTQTSGTAIDLFFKGGDCTNWLATYTFENRDIMLNSAPLLDITANGSSTPLTVNQGDLLTVTASLDPGDNDGVNADWWLAATSPFGMYWFTLDRGWIKSDIPIRVYGGPLFNLTPYSLLEVSTLPAGEYTFYFGIDDNMDNVLNATYLDSVLVTIQ